MAPPPRRGQQPHFSTDAERQMTMDVQSSRLCPQCNKPATAISAPEYTLGVIAGAEGAARGLIAYVRKERKIEGCAMSPASFVSVCATTGKVGK